MMDSRKLDALISDKIFKLPVLWTSFDTDPPIISHNGPKYSTNIQDAWSIVKHLEGAWDIKSLSDGWYVMVAIPKGPYSDGYADAKEATIEMAICMAALRVKGVEV